MEKFPSPLVSSFTKNQVTVNAKVYFCTLNSIPPICRSMFMQLPQGLPCCGFVMSFEIRKCESSLFVLFRYCFGCSGSLEFPYAFYHWLVNLCKKGKRKERHLIFAGDCTEAAVLFVEHCHLNTIRSSGPWMIVWADKSKLYRFADLKVRRVSSCCKSQGRFPSWGNIWCCS